jgi:hypothetical protein
MTLRRSGEGAKEGDEDKGADKEGGYKEEGDCLRLENIDHIYTAFVLQIGST